VRLKTIEAVHGAVGLRVRMIRETLGMSQIELAKRMRLTRTSLTNIEAGRQRLQLHTVEAFAQSLGTSAKHLLRGVWW
jgi:transcriptional regulator with XRE-family HTH domain